MQARQNVPEWLQITPSATGTGSSCFTTAKSNHHSSTRAPRCWSAPLSPTRSWQRCELRTLIRKQHGACWLLSHSAVVRHSRTAQQMAVQRRCLAALNRSSMAPPTKTPTTQVRARNTTCTVGGIAARMRLPGKASHAPATQDPPPYPFPLQGLSFSDATRWPLWKGVDGYNGLPWPPWRLPRRLASLLLLGLLLLAAAPAALAWRDLDPLTPQYKSWVDDNASGDGTARVEHLYRCECTAAADAYCQPLTTPPPPGIPQSIHQPPRPLAHA
jgi:hypothetical protein